MNINFYFITFLFLINSISSYKSLKSLKTSSLSHLNHYSSSDSQQFDEENLKKLMSPKKKQKVIAYYSTLTSYKNSFPVCAIPGDKIDRLIYGYLDVAYDGTCIWGNPQSDKSLGPKSGICGDPYQSIFDPLKGDLYQLIKLKERFPKLQILASIGTNTNNMIRALRNTDLRNKLALSCSNVIKKFSNIFEGVDIDFQFPCNVGDLECGKNGNFYVPIKDDSINYENFIELLRNNLGSSAIMGIVISNDQRKLSAINFKKIDNLVNYYHLKNYDSTGDNNLDKFSGHLSPIFPNGQDPIEKRMYRTLDSAIYYLLSSNISRSKIYFGIAFHGRGFQIQPGTINKEIDGQAYMPIQYRLDFNTSEFKVSYSWIKNNMMSRPSDIFFDSVCKSAYIYDKNTGKFIIYENPRSITNKLQYLYSFRYEGIYASDLSEDTKDFELLHSMNQIIDKYSWS